MNLKPYFDAVQAANAEVMRVASEIDGHFTSGTDEGIQQAMAMRVELEGAQARAAEADGLYASMKAASDRGEAGEAARFVPVNEGAEKVAGSAAKQITRAEYEAMAFGDRHAFLKAGGAIVDQLPE